jgi:NADPH:quinone reductase-like Zn-dependent oxidoreductase
VLVRVRVSSVNGFDVAVDPRRAVQATPVTALPSTQALGRLAADVVDGQLTVLVQRTYELADVPRALADFSAGTHAMAISVA